MSTGTQSPNSQQQLHRLTPTVIPLGSSAPLGTVEPSDVSTGHEYLLEYISGESKVTNYNRVLSRRIRFASPHVVPIVENGGSVESLFMHEEFCF